MTNNEIDFSKLDRVGTTQELLEDAMREGYEEVLIVGMRDDNLTLWASPTLSAAKRTGMLFTAATRLANKGWHGESSEG